MGGTNINQSTDGRIINRNCTLNDSQCIHSTRLVKMEDSSLGNGSSSVSQLLGTVLHKMLSAPALIIRIQIVAGLITMIFLAILTYLGRLNRVTKKWGWNNSRNYMGSLINTVRANHLSILLLLCIDMINIPILVRNEFFDQLGMLKNLYIGVGFQYSHSIKDIKF